MARKRPHVHVRQYKSGKATVVNKDIPKKKRVSFFGFKIIPDRYFLGRDAPGNKGRIWAVKDPKDKEHTYFQLVEYDGYLSNAFGDADKDGIGNIFDKKPLDPGNRKQVPPTVKAGNLKLTSSIGVWSLPRSYTCPGATPLCSKYCYAEPPERYRASVVYSRNKNYAWSKRNDFVSVMSRIIQNMGLKWFRIHEAGDFYDQAYLNKWIEIARNNPQTWFLAYTKNWMLDFSKLPKNFTMRYSSDISSKHIRADLAACYVGVKKPIHFFECKKKCLPGFCMACWDPKIDVYIPIHSVGKEQVDQMFFKQFNPEVPPELVKRFRSRGYKPSAQIIGKSKLPGWP